MKNLIYYKTTADFDNTGEVLIYKSLLEFLRQHGDVIINDGKSIQPKFLSRIGVRENEKLSHHTTLSFIPYMLCSSLIGLMKGQRFYFVTGVGEHSVCGLKSIIKNIASCCFLLLMRLLGVKIIRIGMSMRFGGSKLEYISETILSWLINYYYVRDSISLHNCRKAGVSKCQLAPDLSWGYQSHFTDTGIDRKDVYMSFRYFCETKENSEKYKNKLVETIKQIVYGIAPQIEGNIIFSHQCDEDYDFMKEIYDQLSDVSNLTLCKELITLDNAAEYYGKAKYILSNRLHVLLLGYKYGAPTICVSDIEKHRKIRGIFTDNGLQDVLLDFNTSSKQLLSQLAALTENTVSLEHKILMVENQNWQKLYNIFKCIFTRK